MLIVLSCRVEREQYFLVKLDEFSFMRTICKTPMAKGKTFICSKASVKYKNVKSASQVGQLFLKQEQFINYIYLSGLIDKGINFSYFPKFFFPTRFYLLFPPSE